MVDELDEEAAALEERAKSRLGTTLRDKYCLHRVLGVGGMATVYGATHRNGKEVALKLLHPELVHHPEVRERFLREGYVANQVKHAGAVSVIDDDVTEDGFAFLVMELLRGVTLQELWEARSLRMHPAWVTAIVLQVLDVMTAAHANGIIHRDLKPANLFITREGEVKVLDFGIARMRDVGARTTTAGSVLGTPAFMAPEQALAQAKEIDQQTDVWAIGSVAFALLTGDVVHPAENSQQTLIHAATKHAPPLGPLAPDVAPSLVAVLERALAFKKADRWGTASEMHAALEEAAKEAFGVIPDQSVLRDALREVKPPRTASLPDATTELPPAAASAPSAPSPLAPPAAPRYETSAPLVSDRATLRGLVSVAPKKTRSRDAVGAALLSLAALGGAFLLFHSNGPASAATAASSARSSAPNEVALPFPSTLALVTDAAAEPEPSSAPSRPTATSGAASGATSGATSGANAGEETSDAKAGAASGHPRAATPSPSAAVNAARGHCTPPFVIDPKTGRKVWKMECL